MSQSYIKAEKILCSAGKGEITKPECLACALAGNNTCGYDYTLMKYMHEEPNREGIHVTDLCSCLRKAWYTRKVPVSWYPHDRLVVKLGTAVHEKLEGYEDENFTPELSLNAFGIEGKCDVWFQKIGRIVDYKTTRWITPSKMPYGSHAEQVNIYAAMLRAMGMEVRSAAIQYIDMSGPTKCRRCNAAYVPSDFGVPVCPKCGSTGKEAHLGALLVEIPLEDTETVVSRIHERKDILEASLSSGEPPEREQGYLCDYCPHAPICLV